MLEDDVYEEYNFANEEKDVEDTNSVTWPMESYNSLKSIKKKMKATNTK